MEIVEPTLLRGLTPIRIAKLVVFSLCQFRKPSVRRSLMLIAFDRDRSDRYPGAVYSHLIAMRDARGGSVQTYAALSWNFLNRWLSGVMPS